MAKIEKISINEYKVITITSGLLRQNCFLVKHIPSGDLLLIDPGGAVPDIINTINEEGGNLKLVLLTHAHFDHVGGIKPICETYKLPFWIHSADIKLLKRAPIYAISMEKRVIEISSNYKFIEGPIVEWGGDTIEIIYTPGHTQGSVCFRFSKMIFTGDVILTEQDNKLKLPGFDDTYLTESITGILNELPADTILFPGHGKSETMESIILWWAKKNILTKY
jgi:hydroxyacylglutathione hydrolase